MEWERILRTWNTIYFNKFTFLNFFQKEKKSCVNYSHVDQDKNWPESKQSQKLHEKGQM